MFRACVFGGGTARRRPRGPVPRHPTPAPPAACARHALDQQAAQGAKEAAGFRPSPDSVLPPHRSPVKAEERAARQAADGAGGAKRSAHAGRPRARRPHTPSSRPCGRWACSGALSGDRRGRGETDPYAPPHSPPPTHTPPTPHKHTHKHTASPHTHTHTHTPTPYTHTPTQTQTHKTPSNKRTCARAP